jgi:general secretion pathway protein C
MVSNLHNRWAVAGATFALWALVAASAVFWGLKFTARTSSGPGVPMAARSTAPADPVAVARLLGASPAAAQAPVSAASRFSLVGVVADPRHRGAALISVDGKPPKPFRIGSSVDDRLVLQSVGSRKAVLGESATGPATVTLELPAPKKP